MRVPSELAEAIHFWDDEQGLFVGLILGFFVGTYWMTLLYAVVIGAAVGAATNVLAWFGRR